MSVPLTLALGGGGGSLLVTPINLEWGPLMSWVYPEHSSPPHPFTATPAWEPPAICFRNLCDAAAAWGLQPNFSLHVFPSRGSGRVGVSHSHQEVCSQWGDHWAYLRPPGSRREAPTLPTGRPYGEEGRHFRGLSKGLEAQAPPLLCERDLAPTLSHTPFAS